MGTMILAHVVPTSIHFIAVTVWCDDDLAQEADLLDALDNPNNPLGLETSGKVCAQQAMMLPSMSVLFEFNLHLTFIVTARTQLMELDLAHQGELKVHYSERLVVVLREVRGCSCP